MKFWKDNVLFISLLVATILFLLVDGNAVKVAKQIMQDSSATVSEIEVGFEQMQASVFRVAKQLEPEQMTNQELKERLAKEAEIVVRETHEMALEVQHLDATEKLDLEVIEESTEQEPEVTQYQFQTVDEEYFEDAAFIGDSRTVSLYDYSKLPSDFFCASGLTIYKIFKDPDGVFKDGNWQENIRDSLSEKQYGKIYLMVGINELGVGDAEYYKEHYKEVLEEIHELQPNAIIYIQANMKVTEERSNRGDCINNEELEARNQAIAELADNETYFYIDINEVVCDETGNLDPDTTFDGVHMYANCIDIWTDFLMEHAVVKNVKS